MLDLSIVIVNYNVKEFLSQCLDSIYQSKTDFGFEVIVVDNQSSDCLLYTSPSPRDS